MDTDRISKPGQPGGPCIADCDHAGCRRDFTVAGAHCTVCGQHVGFDTEYGEYAGFVGDEYVHAACMAVFDMDVDDEAVSA